MGCGCKNDVENSVTEHTLETKKNFKEKIGYFLNNRNGFSIIGFIGSLLIIPAVILVTIPMISAAIFSKFTLNKDLDLLKLMVFNKNKKPKK